MTLQVVIADDQAVVRDGLVMLLGAVDDLDVVGVGADGVEAVALALKHRPDVVLVDLRMPNLDGVAVTTALVAQLPDTAILILTTFADDDAVLPALRAGAHGYLTKDASGEELTAAIRSVAAGETVLDPQVQERLVALLRSGVDLAPTPTVDPVPPLFARPGQSGEAPAELPDGLTRREVDIVRLIAQGMSNQQIAKQLVVGEATVKTHLNHVLSKVDVDGRAALVAWAWRNGLAQH